MQFMTLSELLKTTRQYFWKNSFEEVEIPYLNSSLPLESNLYTMKVDWTHTSTKYYLPTSPEFALKKHLSVNKTNCFAISHCFRDLESIGPHHHPEFLMLEYYLVNKNLHDLQKSLENFLSLFFKLKIINYKLPANMPANEPDFNQFFLNKIEPSLPRDCGVFISGYPTFLSPLAQTNISEVNKFSARSLRADIAKGREDGKISLTSARFEPNVITSKRFELYIDGIEIANGYEENRDSESIKSAFNKEADYRHRHHLPTHPISQEFINDCAHLPPCSGVGIGLDRLLMLINHQNHI
jgi:elongation factor P--(R)-beta-lysine ligase